MLLCSAGELRGNSDLDSKKGACQLKDEETISCVRHLRDRLLKAPLSEITSIRIDASEVENIDTAALQVLAYFGNYVEERGISIGIINPSKKFKNQVDILGYERHLKMVA